MTKPLYTCVTILSIFWLQASGQKINSRGHKYLINPKRPGVYITARPVARTDKLTTDLENGHVFLTLHNNLRWSIRIVAGRHPKPGNPNVRVDYEVLIGGAPSVVRECHICTMTEVK